MGTTILEQQTASIFRAENASSVRKNEAVVPFKTLVTVSHTTHRHVVEDRNPVLIFLVINQLDAQNLFYNKFISCLTSSHL